MESLKEIARVLQPTGVLGGIWNIEDCKLDLRVYGLFVHCSLSFQTR
jgi:hypothetical protein